MPSLSVASRLHSVGIEWEVSNLTTILFAAAVFKIGYSTVNVQLVKDVSPVGLRTTDGDTQYLYGNCVLEKYNLLSKELDEAYDCLDPIPLSRFALTLLSPSIMY